MHGSAELGSGCFDDEVRARGGFACAQPAGLRGSGHILAWAIGGWGDALLLRLHVKNYLEKGQEEHRLQRLSQ